jgi:hypothetical protein
LCLIPLFLFRESFQKKISNFYSCCKKTICKKRNFWLLLFFFFKKYKPIKTGHFFVCFKFSVVLIKNLKLQFFEKLLPASIFIIFFPKTHPFLLFYYLRCVQRAFFLESFFICFSSKSEYHKFFKLFG